MLPQLRNKYINVTKLNKELFKKKQQERKIKTLHNYCSKSDSFKTMNGEQQ